MVRPDGAAAEGTEGTGIATLTWPRVTAKEGAGAATLIVTAPLLAVPSGVVTVKV